MDASLHGEVFAGRAAERAHLRDAVTAASLGRPAAVLVRGEAGIGKTRLVEDACLQATEAGFAVLRGRCLRFGEVALPCLPLVGAFEDWLAGADAGDRAEVLAAAPGLSALLPSLGSPGAAVPDEALLATIDRAVNLIAQQQPAVLVVDDVQWADVTSLDVLSYLVAGLRGQRLLLLVTLRDEELDEGDLLHGWLADIVRLPAMSELRLAPMTPDETGEQLRLLLGSEPDPELVGEVVARTGGNPYFTELVATAVEDGRVPTELPEALTSALSATWHRMSPPAREATRMLAVAGRPTSQRVLARACGDEVGAALREAVVAGVVRLDGDRIWFRHPLLAEVLTGRLLPEERTSGHRAFAGVLAEGEAADARDLAALAEHYDAAGMFDEAFEACLVAADAAARVRAFAEESALRVRAAWMYPRVRPDVRDRHGSEASVCRLAAFQARRAGNETGALDLLRRARAVLHLEPDPVQRGLVLLLYAQMARDLGEEREPLDLLHQALELCQGSDAEHALVLAEIAFEEVRTADPDAAGRHADEAVGIAERCGDPLSLAYALGARASALLGTPEGEQAARRGYQVAQAHGSPEWLGITVINLANALEHDGRWVECADLLLGAFHAPGVQGVTGMSQLVGAYAARFLCEVGRFDEAAEVLRRVLLSGRAVGLPGNQARQSAVMLDLRRGRRDEADGHLERLWEMAPGFASMRGGYYGADVLAEHHLAHDRPAEALAVVAEVVGGHAVADPRYGDALLMWAARAAGDLAARSVGDAGALESAGRELQRAVRQREEAAGPAFSDAATNPVTASMQATFLAEQERSRDGSPGRAELWRHAVERAGAAGLLHEQCRVTLALARCLLPSRSGRAEGVDRLREAEALARRMGARPLVDQAESLARLARVPLADPGRVTPVDRDGRGLLTPREQEVLGHLVAGRTYAEIARALVVSEKTVSVHVSNLLRKTGAANRVEAAAWAERHGMTTPPPRG